MVEFVLSETRFTETGGAFIHPSGVADFDKDGRPELVPTFFSFPGGVTFPLQILEFQDDGTLLDIAPQLFGGRVPVMEFGRNLVIGDINGDGDDDLVIADHGFDQAPFPGAPNIVAISDGKGGLTDIGRKFEAQPQFTHTVAVGDFDGDGDEDIFFGNLGVDDAFIGSVTRGGKVVKTSVAVPAGVNQFTTSLGVDLDRDGRDELVLGADNNVDAGARNVVVDLGGPAPVERVLPKVKSFSGTLDAGRGVIALDIETTDLNGDGRADLLILHTGVSPFYQGIEIQALQQTAKGGFRDVTSALFSADDVAGAVADGAPLEIVVDDFDSDGDDDILLVGFFPNDLTLFERQGGKFVAGDRFGDSGAAVAVDVDGDFTPEIVTLSQNNVNIYDNGIAGSPRNADGVPIDGVLLAGGGGAEALAGGAFNDSLDGGGGNDTLTGDDGRDELVGGGGKDSLIGGAGKDTLIGGGGKDALEGGGGSDMLDGGGAKDVLVGGGGKDRLEGGKGADFLTGGGGKDVFVFARGSGKDVVTDFADRKDKFEMGAGIEEFADLTLLARGDDALVKFRGGQILVEDTDAGALGVADFLF